ncbi:hypothetical protein VT84_24675 [Gemmata sp. SH-PL17]|uniref:hypothetical protein n=1 Tax=Gemmata sp. SH-PL17 TaxID=1630693 RepID=UPI00078EC585|nr:hypothetical protein [Gemmata sp. SH-PL17]AMV27620.1 hypothetical protein VT84_24675 [Gemmata sp. SH-PL17]
MEVEIKESVKEAGLEADVRRASELLPEVVTPALQHHVRVLWEVLRGGAGARWVMVALEYDEVVTERELLEPETLSDTEALRDRFVWLWDRVLRTRTRQRVREPLEPLVFVTDE